MIIFLVVFVIQGCTLINSQQKPQEYESIKRSDTEFLCKKIDCGDENGCVRGGNCLGSFEQELYDLISAPNWRGMVNFPSLKV